MSPCEECEEMVYRVLPTTIGELLLAGVGQRLRFIGLPWGKGHVTPGPNWRPDPTAFEDAARQLDEYFAGERREFDLELDLEGTEFQRSVWRALEDIPYGATESYGELAARLGRPGASRAVGAANGSNPIPIVLPCHRVIGSSGSLTGYGGGLDAKRSLLELEGLVVSRAGKVSATRAHDQAMLAI